MTNEPVDARDRLLTPDQLIQVAALLNMPLKEEETTSGGGQQARRQVALYAKIADWAWTSAQAAGQAGELAQRRYAFLLEYCDDHSKGWHRAPGKNAEGVELSADTAETVASSVLGHYLTYLAENRDEYQLWLVDSLSIRISVWDVDIVTAGQRREWKSGRRRNSSGAKTLDESAVSPHAVEIRTPIQVHRLVESRLPL